MNELIEQDWLEKRRKHVTGSDIAPLLGLSNWGDALSVWEEKMGLAPPREENMQHLRGKAMEEVIAQRYQKETRFTVKKLPGDGFIEHETHKWIGGTPDRIIPSQRGLLEVKTPGYLMRNEWGKGLDDVPTEAFFQGHWYIGLTDASFCDVACHIDSEKEIRIYTLRRDVTIVRIAFKAAREFYEKHMVTGRAPTTNMCEADSSRLMDLLHPQQTDRRLESTEEIDIQAAALAAVRKQIKELNSRKAKIETTLKAAIDQYDGVDGKWGRITWRKPEPSPSVDWQAIAIDLGVTKEQILEHTHFKQGARRFTVSFKEGEE